MANTKKFEDKIAAQWESHSISLGGELVRIRPIYYCVNCGFYTRSRGYMARHRRGCKAKDTK